jgi:hypothetical protein
MIALLKQKTASRSFLLIISMALLLVGTTAAFVLRKADFKGDWTFNEGKSKLGEGRFRMAPQKLKVTNEGESVTIERTNNTPNGETATSSEKLTFDGKATESTVFGSAKKSSVASWTANGEELTINSTLNFERDGQSFEVKTTEVWKLLDGGKTLSIDYTSVSQRGTNNQTFVYDKN